MATNLIYARMAADYLTHTIWTNTILFIAELIILLFLWTRQSYWLFGIFLAYVLFDLILLGEKMNKLEAIIYVK